MPDLNSLPPSTRSPPPPSHPPPPASNSSASLPPSSSSVAMSLSSPTNNSEAASSQSNRHRQPSSPSPSLSPSRTAATSLQAAATVNAGLHHGSRRSSGSLSRQAATSSRDARRQSQVLMNLQLNDPAVPGPGEMRHETNTRRSSNVSSPVALSSTSPFLIATSGDPNHDRSPSLGELHQEMEAEQEASVNRLLVQIREQQVQIRQLQQDQSSAIAGDDSSETAFYQAETSMLVRENQMLRHRVRELERQLEGLAREQPKDEGTRRESHLASSRRSRSISGARTALKEYPSTS